MKKIITACVIFLCSLSLVSCQAMSNQDTGVIAGGIAGGLLGHTIGGGSGRILATAAGTIAGAMIGGSVGRSMDRVDRMRMNRALENNSVGRPAYWYNDHSDTYYEFIPVRNITIHGNRYCREYRTIAKIGGRKEVVYGTACRQSDGSWRIVR
jgi:surface antigen